MHKAIFLDRDGVVIQENGSYNYRIEDIQFNDGIVESLRFFQSKGYWLFIITNQGGIARKIYGHKEVRVAHKTIKEFMQQYGIKIKAIYYCPHHESTGRCLCRKPDSLLLEKAIAKYDIDTSRSYFIGDQERDILAGEKAGLKSILIQPNEKLENYHHLF